jgi:molybdopterin-guanine dinucleotide biosynthesis protein B
VKVVVLAGYSGSGKTTLAEKLVPALKALGQRVSVVKHAHHSFEMDRPGKDTWRHREAGAFEVVAASPHRLVLQREFEQTVELSVHQVLAELYPGVDWVLVEGYRDCDLPKLEVWRASTGKPVRYPDDPFIAAIATDSPGQLPEPTQRPLLDLNHAAEVAQWLQAQGERFVYDAAQFDV